MHFADCAALATYYFVHNFNRKFGLCSSAEAGLFLNFEQM